MIKEINLFIIFILAIYSAPNGVQAGTAPTVSWYWQGSARTNYSLTVNTGSALVLGCQAKGANNVYAATTTVSPAFVVTKGSAPTLTLTVAVTSASPFSLTANGGTLLWDSISGNAAGYDHIIAVPSISLPPSVITTFYPVSGFLQMYIPSLTSSDAGLYYCTFFDGSTASVAAADKTYTSSSYFSLTMTTKSGSGSSKSAQRNKVFEYSIALLGASKMLF